VEEQYLTREEAAEACGCHPDTIRRRQYANKLPGHRISANGCVEIPVSDLIACGLLDPLAATGNVVSAITRSRSERELDDTRTELAIATAQLASANERIDDLRRQIDFLQGLITDRAA
jgi:hypothetical protein